MPDDDDKRGPKEVVYDEQISPLMTKIIALCNEHKISMVADFALDADEDGEPLYCSTMIFDAKVDPEAAKKFAKIKHLMSPQPAFTAFTIIGGPKEPKSS